MTELPDRRALAVVAFAALILVAAVPVAVAVAPGLVGADASYVVRSDGMAPTVSAGDVFLTAAVPPEDIRAGDVITYRTDGEGDRTTRRVVEVVEEDGDYYYRTRGDADESADPRLVSAGDLEGRMVLVIPRVGYLLTFAQTDAGLAAFGLSAALLLLTEGWAFVRSLRGDPGRPLDDLEKEQPNTERA